MKVRDEFAENFSETNLKRIFTEHVVYSNATGIDNLNQYAFRWQLDDQARIISRKVKAGTYKFTKYKLKLISKGRGKKPREIAIPTVRDRIAIRAMCDFLTNRFRTSVNMDLPQDVIKRVKTDVESAKYDAFIKLDVADFYPSIKHDELKSRLRKRIKSPEIIDMVSSAISAPTVTTSKEGDKLSLRGVPQGLAISNILAAIYLINIDRYMKAFPDIAYYRFVDDVLILCNKEKAEDIANKVISKFKQIGLTVHDPITTPEKSQISDISSDFTYLGYRFSDGLVSAKKATIEKLKTSLVAIFTSYKHSKNKNTEFLLWRLNLRITGCIFENKRKGWLFFFSEINDEPLLHTLDHYVQKLKKRFNVDVDQKKFVRAFKELTHRKYETNYIPDFDNYTTEQQKNVLVMYFRMNIADLRDEDIEFEFHKRIGKQVKDLLEDVKGVTS